jgi:hypothetical protein
MPMGQQEEVYHWQQMLQAHMPSLSKPQLKVLALFSVGLILAERCRLESVAMALGAGEHCPSLVRRLQRFLANPRLNHIHACVALSQWVMGALGRGGVVVLLVDETTIKDKLRAMVVALAYRGRAIPLAWKCYREREGREPQVEVISKLLDIVETAVGPGAQVLVQADRGIGTSPALLSDIERRQWYYLMRVQRLVSVRTADGEQVAIGELVRKRGDKFEGEVQAFKKAGWLTVRALCQWRRKHKEPWLLVTNCPWVRTRHYGMRMWEEEAFRDLKSGGFQWHRSHVYNPDHADILWLIMAVAYLRAIAYGEYARRRRKFVKQLGLCRPADHSLFRLGLRLLQLLLPRGLLPLADIRLAYPPLRLKNVV